MMKKTLFEYVYIPKQFVSNAATFRNCSISELPQNLYISLCQLHRSVRHDRCKLWRVPYVMKE